MILVEDFDGMLYIVVLRRVDTPRDLSEPVEIIPSDTGS